MSDGIQLNEKYQVLPSMPDEQFAALKADIAERGVLTPIDVDEDGHILDGHHNAVIYDNDYEMFGCRPEADTRDWWLFVLWLAGDFRENVDGAIRHAEWVSHREYQNPSDWFEDDKFRAINWMKRVPKKVKKSWEQFKAENSNRDTPSVEAELEKLPSFHERPADG